MKFDQKTRLEKVFILVACMFTVFLLMLCLGGCGDSCFGFRFGCDSGENHNLAGASYESGGCCSSSSCKASIGTVDTNNEDSALSDLALVSCTNSKSGCDGDSSCYTSCFVGKDVDCGDWGIAYGSPDSQQIIGCIDGDLGCSSENGYLYDLLQFVYGLLGI